MPEVVENPPPQEQPAAEDDDACPLKKDAPPAAADVDANGEATAAAEHHEDDATNGEEEGAEEGPAAEENGRASPVEEPKPEEEKVPVVSEVDGDTCVRRMRQDWNNKQAPGEVPEKQANGGPRKVAMSTSLDTENVRAAYDDVRSDSSDTQWAVFKFEGAKIRCGAKGADFAKFQAQFSENERAFGYIRIQTGDEMSKRSKFLFVTWVGQDVSVLQRAKMSTDKSVIKNVISNFAVELQLENLGEVDLKKFVEELNKAGGANYGTGVRDI